MSYTSCNSTLLIATDPIQHPGIRKLNASERLPGSFSSSVGGNSDSRQTPIGATSDSRFSNQSG